MSHRAFNNRDMRELIAAKNTAIEALRAEVAELQAENQLLRVALDKALEVAIMRPIEAMLARTFPAADD